MTEYNITINWPKWAQALRIITTGIVVLLVLFIMYMFTYGSAFSGGKKEGFKLGIAQCHKIEATYLP